MAKKILLADDSITIQKVVELILSDEDYEIVSVSSGDEALAMIEQLNPDIVLADIDMPNING
ncbi:MAG: response regulator, partial [Candidatus Magnetoovum sp. WYHC-5]|nr:response regulator [Candidatus Magnetoovum sp. WYHC-5]